MKPASRLLCTLSLVVAVLAPCAALADPAIIYLVRHGEKAASGKDPELTADGQARARNIAVTLQKTGIKSIFSTPYMRTRQTAQALAVLNGVEVQGYDPKAPAALVKKVKMLTGAVLVVGHSDTLPELVRMFGGAAGADIADNEYDRLYQLIVGADGVVTTVLLTSLPATGPVR